MSQNLNNKYDKLYLKIFKILGDYTPLKADCGKLCDGACCKGDKKTGMLLFPFEKSYLPITINENGEQMVVCSGVCDRNQRPLACRIFPFFPTVSSNNKIFVELDYRAARLCPMIEHYDDILFDKRFLRAVKKIGKLLIKDESCKEFLIKSTEEIDLYYDFFVK